MGKTQNWTPNETQTKFMEILAKAGKPITLKEIEVVYGQKFATGCINTLITKGKVNVDKVDIPYIETQKFEFNGISQVVETKKTKCLTQYALVGFDYEADKKTTMEEPTKEDRVADVVEVDNKEVDNKEADPNFDIDKVDLDF